MPFTSRFRLSMKITSVLSIALVFLIGQYHYITQIKNGWIESNERNPTTKRRKLAESFVISMNPKGANEFIKRNSGMEVLWVPGVDGKYQPTLDMWAKMIGNEPPMNTSLYDPHNKTHKGQYRSPHAVGCYLAHWHLLRSFDKRPVELRPDVYMVFEDDCSCVPDVVNRTLDAIRQLPPDWDLFWIGGKPFTEFSKPATNASTETDALRRDICQGKHRMGDSPLAPDGSRELSTNQPYWQIKYLTNMHAYVVNPLRIDKVLKVLEPRANEPIDIRLADAMKGGDVNAYMPTKKWCDQMQLRKGVPVTNPEPWDGFYYIPGLGRQHFWQTRLQLDNCSY